MPARSSTSTTARSPTSAMESTSTPAVEPLAVTSGRNTWVNFHVDYSRRTLQVALNGDEAYAGGRLVFATGHSGFMLPPRPAGSATVHAGRSEALADGSLDGFVSRAYKPPARVLDEDARRLLRPGGQVVLLLGDDPDVQAPAGFVETDRRRYAVEDGHRVRVVMRREAP